MHADLGTWLGDAATAAIQAAGLSPDDVRAVASHGQTLWHEPGHSTWQLGDAAQIAERSGCAVVHDFRVRDMAVGGQGAPLVPMADRLLFAHDSEWRALQNIGGIGNVSLVPPRSLPDHPVLAFDTGPGVVVLDSVVRRLFAQPFDTDGQIARRGRVLESVVRDLLDLWKAVGMEPTGSSSAPPAKPTEAADGWFCGHLGTICLVATRFGQTNEIEWSSSAADLVQNEHETAPPI